MRTILLAAALVASAFAGCMAEDESTGRFSLAVTDAPDAIGDFAFLNVTVSKITLTGKDNATRDLSPADGTFDLTKLVEGNTTSLFNGSVATGEYSRLDLFIENATGVLAEGGEEIMVGVPSGRIFLNTRFTVSESNETSFLFDIQVHQTGNGEYQLKPNADGSGPNKRAK